MAGSTTFRAYNIIGWLVVASALAAGTFLFPFQGSPLKSLAVTFGYYALCWLLIGIYLGNVVHMALAHRAMDVKPWFLYTIMIVNNVVGLYLNLIGWSNRHRLHHLYSDHPGDPNKRPQDGFWMTFYRSQFPYPSIANTLKEPIFHTWPVRLFNNVYFGVVSQFTSYGLLWLAVGDWRLALVLWLGARWLAAYVHWIQNYWAHDKRFGTRRYQDEDEAMNIDNWLPVTLTWSACLQNNHHHSPRFIRLSHSKDEFDMGFITMRWLSKLGLVKVNEAGRTLPDGADLKDVGL